MWKSSKYEKANPFPQFSVELETMLHKHAHGELYHWQLHEESGRKEIDKFLGTITLRLVVNTIVEFYMRTFLLHGGFITHTLLPTCTQWRSQEFLSEGARDRCQ